MPFNQFETLNLIENEQTQHTNYWGKNLFFLWLMCLLWIWCQILENLCKNVIYKVLKFDLVQKHNFAFEKQSQQGKNWV